NGSATGCTVPPGGDLPDGPGTVTNVSTQVDPNIAPLITVTTTDNATTPLISFTPPQNVPAHGFWANNDDADVAAGWANIPVDDLPEELAGTHGPNLIWATPDSTTGTPTLRSMVPNDLHGLPSTNQIFAGSNVEGILGYNASTGNVYLQGSTGVG